MLISQKFLRVVERNEIILRVNVKTQEKHTSVCEMTQHLSNAICITLCVSVICSTEKTGLCANNVIENISFIQTHRCHACTGQSRSI